jgi:hypothetical protein
MSLSGASLGGIGRRSAVLPARRTKRSRPGTRIGAPLRVREAAVVDAGIGRFVYETRGKIYSGTGTTLLYGASQSHDSGSP